MISRGSIRRRLKVRGLRVFRPESLAPKMRQDEYSHEKGARDLARRKGAVERRGWVRLPLAIPVFVRSRDQSGKEFLEFATALNISAGGALVAVHRVLRPPAQVSLEIPSAPLAASAPVPKSSRSLRAEVVRVTHGEGYHLVGVKFNQALLNSTSPRVSTQRKLASSV